LFYSKWLQSSKKIFARVVQIELYIRFFIYFVKTLTQNNMKKKIGVLAVLIIGVLLNSTDLKAQSTDEAIAYNDKMIAVQSVVDQSLVELIDAIDSFDPEFMKLQKAETLKKIDEGIKKVSKMEKFDGTAFKKEMKKLLVMYKEITNNELTKVVEILSTGKEMTDADWDRYDALYASALEKYNAAFDKFNAFQAEFGEKFGFSINTGE
jgi:hypothetical protein